MRPTITRLTTIAALLLITAPLASEAQPAINVPRIAVLMFFAAPPVGPNFAEPFREGLRELGYVEGQNIAIEYRYAEGQADRLSALAAELVRLKVDIIVAAFTPAVRAAKDATRTIPIVMAPAGEPVGTGLVTSLAHPGGNVTGISGTSAELAGKRLELLREVVPRATRIGILIHRTDPFTRPLLEQSQAAAKSLGLDLRPVVMDNPKELATAFSGILKAHVGALVVQTILTSAQLAKLAISHHLPTISDGRVFVESGGLMTYSANWPILFRRSAIYVDKILKGVKPADLPVEQPTKFELVINLKTAKALGVTMPPSLLLRADQVIE